MGVTALLFLCSEWIWAIEYGEGAGEDFSNERNYCLSCVWETALPVLTVHSYKVHILYYRPYSGFLSREKTCANFGFSVAIREIFSAKIYFQAIRYRASGRGALGYRKFAKVFSAKICFQAIRESFLPQKKPAIW